MEKTEGMKPLEIGPDNTEAKQETTATRHPAEMEADYLRSQLHNERIKTDALSRRCIQLGTELDAFILADERRAEKEMFDTINGNCYHKKAAKLYSQRCRAQDKKVAEAYTKAYRHNAVALSTSAVIAFSVMILGFVGFINSALAVIIAGVAAAAFGWALNNCVYLLGRCE